MHLVCSQVVSDPQIRAAVASLRELDLPEPGEVVPSRWARRVRDLWFATLGRQPREVVGGRAVRRKLAAALADASADVVLVEYAALAPLHTQLRETAPRRLLTLHNVGSVMAAQHAAVEPGGRQRWMHVRDAAQWRRWEKEVVESYDTVITVSEDDRLALGARKNLCTIPNGVQLERFRTSELPTRPRLVFTGALYTLPNRDGIGWFCREVMPLVASLCPEATLEIVGLRPPPEVLALSDAPGVTVVADVADIAPHLEAARVAVVPLRIGSGTRLKALEAMAATRPIVGTTIGLGGLGLVDGVHVAMADRPEEMAQRVLRALTDDAWARSLVAAGRQFVEEHYGWVAIQERFIDVVLGEDAEPTVRR